MKDRTLLKKVYFLSFIKKDLKASVTVQNDSLLIFEGFVAIFLISSSDLDKYD